MVGSQVNGYNSLTLLGGISGGGGDAVAMSMPRGDLFVDSDMEVGPVTSSGPGGLHIGGAPGLNEPGSINGSDGEPVTVSGGSLVANLGSTTGPLSMSGASILLLGTNPKNNGATRLDVRGAVTLGSSVTTKSFIDNNGSSAGTDFSQLSASGNITLGGKLVLGQGLSNSNNTGSCVALNSGDVATLVTTTGTLSGTFANAPGGATLTMANSCESTPPRLQIAYTSHSVTATVVSGTSTTSTQTLLAAPSPSPAATNQTVTLTATVSTQNAGSVAPAGTVAFSDNAGVISGCASQPLSGTGSSATATCTTSFSASGSPESLTAVFQPSSGSGQATSTSSAQTLTINPTGSTTALSASNTKTATSTSRSTTSPPRNTQRPPATSHVSRGTVPALTRVSQSHVRWREPHTRARSRERHGAAVPVGTRVTFSVNARVRVTLTFVQVLAGRRVGRRCVAPSKAGQRARACRRTRIRGRLVRSESAGTHHVRFAGRAGGMSLPAGHYSLTMRATGRHGARSRTRTVHFTIVG